MLLSKQYVSSLTHIWKVSQESNRNTGLTPTPVELIRTYVDEDQATFENWWVNWEDYEMNTYNSEKI